MRDVQGKTTLLSISHKFLGYPSLRPTNSITKVTTNPEDRTLYDFCFRICKTTPVTIANLFQMDNRVVLNVKEAHFRGLEFLNICKTAEN